MVPGSIYVIGESARGLLHRQLDVVSTTVSFMLFGCVPPVLQKSLLWHLFGDVAWHGIAM
jgi:hypothetical protein